MTETVGIKRHNAAYIKILCSDGVARELSDRFSFMSDKARFDKRYKQKLWDGRIRLFNRGNRTILAGLKQLVIDYCVFNKYEVIDGTAPIRPADVSDETIAKFMKVINLPADKQPRDYQLRGLKLAASERRCLLQSATNSGKTLLMYMIYRWFNKKTLIIVPTTTLVRQSAGDFRDYGYQDNIAEIFAESNVDRENLPQVTISTWQSVQWKSDAWLSQFEVIIGDEAHMFNPGAATVVGILEKASADIRIGMSGSLEDSKLHVLTYQGLFGKIHELIRNREMIDRGFSSQLKIKCIVLEYPDEECQRFAKVKPEYKTEIDFLIDHTKRHKFVCSLSKRLDGNSLTLFRRLEHGQLMFESIKQHNPNTYYVAGSVDVDERNDIRQILETSTKNDVVASYKTFATGISITNLNNIIFGHPTKAKNTVTQAIGRVLRKGDEKTEATLYDVVDDLRWKSYENHTYRHFLERLELYESEELEYEIVRIKL